MVTLPRLPAVWPMRGCDAMCVARGTRIENGNAVNAVAMIATRVRIIRAVDGEPYSSRTSPAPSLMRVTLRHCGGIRTVAVCSDTLRYAGDDTMHGERVGGRFVAAVLLLAVVGNAAFAQEHKTYRCKVAEVVRLDDGRLHSDSNPKDILRQRFDGVIIDALTGAVTYPDGGREVWNVVQPGNIGNDHVLTRPTAPDLSPDRIKATIRIRAWKETPTVQLLAFDLSGVATGPCEVVR